MKIFKDERIPKEKSDQEEFSWSMEMFSQNIDSVIESQNLVNRAKTLLGYKKHFSIVVSLLTEFFT